MSGAYEQQRDTGGRRGWWLVGSFAVFAAAGAGAFAGYRLDPDVREVVPSLAVAGLGLGGVIGLLLLAPVGLWRAWRQRTRRQDAHARARGRARRHGAVAHGRPEARGRAGRCGGAAGAGRR